MRTESKIRTLPPRRPYWSERQGRGPRAEPISFERFRKLVFSDFDEFFARDYFQKAFGHSCVDDNDVIGEVTNASAFFLRVIGREDVWHYWNFGETYDLDTLIDVIEVLHDLVARPVDGHFHGFNDCGWHYERFDRPAGQAEYREILNETLRLWQQPLQLQDTGEVVLLHSPELERMLDAPLPDEADDQRVLARINEARRLFRSRHSTPGDQRRAVRELIDALEALRSDAKVELLTNDERDLFKLANNYALRHNDAAQKGNYDALWFGYFFQIYLATLHLLLRLRPRNGAR